MGCSSSTPGAVDDASTRPVSLSMPMPINTKGKPLIIHVEDSQQPTSTLPPPSGHPTLLTPAVTSPDPLPATRVGQGVQRPSSPSPQPRRRQTRSTSSIQYIYPHQHPTTTNNNNMHDKNMLVDRRFMITCNKPIIIIIVNH